MTDALLNLLHDVMSSPWIYLALFALAWLDGFVPAFPSESGVIAAGVFATSGQPHWALVMLAAAAGAFAGDHTSYFLGRGMRHRASRNWVAGTRRANALDRARRALHARGGLMIIVARYVPGGRTAVTMTAGLVDYPLRRFSTFAAIAAASWAIYGTVVGLVGGAAFEREPLKGVALGIGLALLVTALVEIARFIVGRRSARRSPEVQAPKSAAPQTGQPAPRQPDAVCSESL